MLWFLSPSPFLFAVVPPSSLEGFVVVVVVFHSNFLSLNVSYSGLTRVEGRGEPAPDSHLSSHPLPCFLLVDREASFPGCLGKEEGEKCQAVRRDCFPRHSLLKMSSPGHLGRQRA